MHVHAIIFCPFLNTEEKYFVTEKIHITVFYVNYTYFTRPFVILFVCLPRRKVENETINIISVTSFVVVNIF